MPHYNPQALPQIPYPGLPLLSRHPLETLSILAAAAYSLSAIVFGWPFMMLIFIDLIVFLSID